jgi:hypothetical protein
MAGKNHISSPVFLRGDVDPSVAPGAAAPVGCLFQHEIDGRLWTKFGVADTAWREFITTATNGPAILTWGVESIGSAADVRWLPPGHDMGVAILTETMRVPCPRAGTLRRLYVYHNAAVGNGQPVDYTVYVNGVATPITVALATGAIGFAFDIVNTAAVLAGNAISLRASKVAAIGSGLVQPQVSLEVG